MTCAIIMEFDGTTRVLQGGLSHDGAGRLMREMADAWARTNGAVYTRLDDDTYLLDGGVMRRGADGATTEGESDG